MPPKLDETYEPRPWRCGECRRVLGVVMRDTSRVRRLWVFSRDRGDADVPTSAGLRSAPRGMYKIHGVDSSQGVECSVCGALTEWSMSKEAFDKLISGRKMVPAVSMETESVAGSMVDGVE